MTTETTKDPVAILRDAMEELMTVHIGTQPEFSLYKTNPDIWKAYIKRVCTAALAAAERAATQPAGDAVAIDRYELVETSYGHSHMTYWDKALEPDSEGEWCKYSDVQRIAAAPPAPVQAAHLAHDNNGEDCVAPSVQAAPDAVAWHEGAPDGTENGFYAYHPDLIDADYNPHGVVEAISTDDGFIGAVWNNTHDCWDALPIEVAMWRPITGPTAPAVQAAPVGASLLKQSRDALALMLDKRGYGCGEGSDHQVEAHNHKANEAARDAIAAIDATPTAPERTSEAGELPPLPKAVAKFGQHSSVGEHFVYTADQMRAYVLADRAARQSPSTVTGSVGDDEQFKCLLYAYAGVIHRGDTAARMDAARDDLSTYIDTLLLAARSPVAAAPSRTLTERDVRIITRAVRYLEENECSGPAGDLKSLLDAAPTAAPESAEPSADPMMQLLNLNQRFKSQGWRDMLECPTDTEVEFMEFGSTGIHKGVRLESGDVFLAPDGEFSMPIMWRALATSSAAKGAA